MSFNDIVVNAEINYKGNNLHNTHLSHNPAATISHNVINEQKNNDEKDIDNDEKNDEKNDDIDTKQQTINTICVMGFSVDEINDAFTQTQTQNVETVVEYLVNNKNKSNLNNKNNQDTATLLSMGFSQQQLQHAATATGSTKIAEILEFIFTQNNNNNNNNSTGAVHNNHSNVPAINAPPFSPQYRHKYADLFAVQAAVSDALISENVEEVLLWLGTLNLEQHLVAFVQYGADSLDMVKSIRNEDLDKMDIENLKPLHRRKLLQAITALSSVGGSSSEGDHDSTHNTPSMDVDSM